MTETTVVLVEGESDLNAVTTLAHRLGIDLTARGIDVVAMGGAAGFGDHLEALGDATVLGLCDDGEVPDLLRALGREGSNTDDLPDLGFFVCVRDLEDEMIRANGTERVLEVIESQGELRVFEKFQLQPEWRGRPLHDQLRRFLGTRSGRKVRFGRLLAESVDLDRIPAPLLALLNAL